MKKVKGKGKKDRKNEGEKSEKKIA